MTNQPVTSVSTGSPPPLRRLKQPVSDDMRQMCEDMRIEEKVEWQNRADARNQAVKDTAQRIYEMNVQAYVAASSTPMTSIPDSIARVLWQSALDETREAVAKLPPLPPKPEFTVREEPRMMVGANGQLTWFNGET